MISVSIHQEYFEEDFIVEQHITCSFFGHRKIELTEELRHKTEYEKKS